MAANRYQLKTRQIPSVPKANNMTITIDTSSRIAIDGVGTGLAMTQARDKTIIYTPHPYKEHAMPYNRYSAAFEYPHKVGALYNPSITAGSIQLESDIKWLLKNQ